MTATHNTVAKSLCLYEVDKESVFNVAHFLEHPGNGRKVVRFRRHAVIFSQGEDANTMFFILKGEVRLTVVSNRGKESVLAILREGDFVGESCLLARPSRTCSAIAQSPCLVMQLTRTVVAETVRLQPAMAEKLISYVLRRTMRVEDDFVDVLVNPAERRLARAIWLLANAEGQGPRKIKVSQSTLADMIGTTRSRVNEFMMKFQKTGHITFDGFIEVHASLLGIIDQEDGPDACLEERIKVNQLQRPQW